MGSEGQPIGEGVPPYWTALRLFGVLLIFGVIFVIVIFGSYSFLMSDRFGAKIKAANNIQDGSFLITVE